jgi:hypothetical protein
VTADLGVRIDHHDLIVTATHVSPRVQPLLRCPPSRARSRTRRASRRPLARSAGRCRPSSPRPRIGSRPAGRRASARCRARAVLGAAACGGDADAPVLTAGQQRARWARVDTAATS